MTTPSGKSVGVQSMQSFSQVLRQIEEKSARKNPNSRKEMKRGWALKTKEEAQREERERRGFGLREKGWK